MRLVFLLVGLLAAGLACSLSQREAVPNPASLPVQSPSPENSPPIITPSPVHTQVPAQIIATLDIKDTGQTQIDIAPYLNFDGSMYQLEIGQTVTFTWRDAPTTATRVEFYFIPSGTGTGLYEYPPVATDNNPADGASAEWVVSANFATLAVRAFMPDGTSTPRYEGARFYTVQTQE